MLAALAFLAAPRPAQHPAELDPGFFTLVFNVARTVRGWWQRKHEPTIGPALQSSDTAAPDNSELPTESNVAVSGNVVRLVPRQKSTAVHIPPNKDDDDPGPAAA